MKYLILTILLLPLWVSAQSFTASDINTIETKLALTTSQSNTATKLLTKLPLNYNEIENVVTIINKLIRLNPLGQKDIQYIISNRNVWDLTQYFSEKTLKTAIK